MELIHVLHYNETALFEGKKIYACIYGCKKDWSILAFGFCQDPFGHGKMLTFLDLSCTVDTRTKMIIIIKKKHLKIKFPIQEHKSKALPLKTRVLGFNSRQLFCKSSVFVCTVRWSEVWDGVGCATWSE